MMVGLGQVVHQMAKGISKRTVRMPWPDLRALFPRACLVECEKELKSAGGADVLAGELVGGCGSLVLRRDITSHI